MTRGMWIGSTAIAVCATVATALAHGGGASGRGGQIPQGSITVIGCLKTADAASTTGASSQAGTTGTTGTTATSTSNAHATKPAGYMLTNASLASSPATWPRGGASGGGTSPAADAPAGPARGPAATTPSVYALEGTRDALQPHVNQQVQITGQLDAPAGTPAKSGTSTASGAKAPSTPESGHATQRLRVESVRVLADACSMR